MECNCLSNSLAGRFEVPEYKHILQAGHSLERKSNLGLVNDHVRTEEVNMNWSPATLFLPSMQEYLGIFIIIIYVYVYVCNCIFVCLFILRNIFLRCYCSTRSHPQFVACKWNQSMDTVCNVLDVLETSISWPHCPIRQTRRRFSP